MRNKKVVNTQVLSRFIVIAITLFVSLSINAKQTENFRNLRYCEVVVGHGFKASVYNSVGLNSCPENLWKNLNEKKLKKQTNASFIYLNGPRYFTFDKVVNTSFYDQNIKTFGGIQMRVGGIVKITLKDIIRGFRPYKKHHVARKSTWVYSAGKPIYELISPTKQVYVMQSFSTEVVKLNEESLPKLGSMIKLPKGWKFKTGVLDKEAKLVTMNNKAVVVQDSLKNTYQLASHDFLG
ncbi:MAG: hypothetical protein P1U74_05010 [Legionellaceae bacterium]|nr:hypothetical protein [Legionellaceae bacterium]